jgi:hypothetical protein
MLNVSGAQVEEVDHVVIVREVTVAAMLARARKEVHLASLLPASEVALVVVVALLHPRGIFREHRCTQKIEV